MGQTDLQGAVALLRQAGFKVNEHPTGPIEGVVGIEVLSTMGVATHRTTVTIGFEVDKRTDGSGTVLIRFPHLDPGMAIQIIQRLVGEATR